MTLNISNPVDTHIQNDDPEKALEVAESLDKDSDAVKVSPGTNDLILIAGLRLQ